MSSATTAAPHAIRVGIVGASADGGWARESHVPAIQGLDGYELVAVATRNQPSAQAAAEAFGATEAFADAIDMARSPSIDLVTVAVRVPAHRDIVLAALEAGKHVVCEWPLARDLAESQELAGAATAASGHSAIGLQARMSPAVRRMSELLEDGSVGRVLFARALDSTIAFGPVMPPGEIYLEDPANGATHVSIHVGHTLDLVRTLLGAPQDCIALATTQYPEIEVGQGGERQARVIPDHVAVQGRLPGGAALTVEVAGGRPPQDTPFRLDVVGTEHTLSLVGGAPRGFQSGRLRLEVDGAPEPVTQSELAPLDAAAANVGGLYAAVRDDIANATATVPTFDDAVELTRLLDTTF